MKKDKGTMFLYGVINFMLYALPCLVIMAFGTIVKALKKFDC